MKYDNTAPSSLDYKMLQLDQNIFEDITYSDTNVDIHKRETKRFSNVYDDNLTEQFKDMQDNIMKNEIPILSRLLTETSFDIGYESFAERYFDQLSAKYGVIADTVLQNIYLQNMYDNQYLLKHLLFIVGNLPTLITLRDKTNVGWFRDYINDVIDELNEE